MIATIAGYSSWLRSAPPVRIGVVQLDVAGHGLLPGGAM